MTKITQKEIDIIKKAKAGDELAFNTLFYKYKPLVENILVDYIKDMDESKDIANIVFLKVYDNLSKFTNYETFGGWIRTLTKNTAIDYLRTVKIIPSSLDITGNVVTSYINEKANEDDLINHITFENVLEIIKNLPEKHKKINNLYYIEGLTILQISKVLSTPVGTIKSILYRTKKMLKTKLNKQL